MKIQSVVILTSVAAFSQLAAAAPEIPLHHAAPSPGSDIDSLIRDLGDESFRVREKATREIWELGDAAIPALDDAAESASPERAYRARDLLRKIRLHITPETDPSVTNLVERYLKGSPSEKSSVLGKLKGKRAWHQMLKLYAAETQAELREQLAPAMNGVATRAARERLLQGDAKGAREFLEMAPADAEGLLALAEFHRSHGSLEAELERIKQVEGRKAAAWRLALERAAGNLKGARDAAVEAGEPRIAAIMAALAGDPLPWLRQTGAGPADEVDPMADAYADVAAKRWLGEKVRVADLEPLVRTLASKNARQSGAAMNALFLLGEVAAAEPVFAKADPLSAFHHFDSLERIPEALEALGLDPGQPEYEAWIGKRVAALQAQDIEDQEGVSTTAEELVALANFLERRGLHDKAFEAFSGPLAAFGEKNENQFADFLRTLFGSSDSLGGAPILAKRIGLIWAGDDDMRWGDLVVAAVGDDDRSVAWWDWLPVLDPKADRAKRLDGILALFSIGPDPANLREHWLALAWKAVEEASEEDRPSLIEPISDLVNQTGDVANSFRAWEAMPEEARSGIFWGQHAILLSALERWDDAAAVILKQIDAIREAKQDPGPEIHAYAASALRRAGNIQEAAIHDAWVNKLALGNPALAMRIGNGYAYGCDYQRAGEWWARAARESDPDSGEFAIALKLHGDSLLEDGRWMESAAVSEVLARIHATSDFRWTSPLPFMRQRLQADMARALANLETRRAESIALLERCHQMFASDGALADFFFPALRKAGLIREHDRWFGETWNLMEAMIRKYPGSDNTRNTAAWFASRARLQLDAAEKHLAVAIAANPNQSAYLDTMAEIHFARGDRKKALEWSRLAVNFTPDDSQLRRQQERFRSDPLPQR